TAGAGVNLPVASPSSACGTDGWTFAGWATASQAETTTAPTLYAANSNYKPSSDCTLYAVYSKTEEGSGPTKWTVATSIAAGDVVVISTNQNYTAQPMKTAGTISSSLMGCCASTYNSDKSEITSLASGTLQFTIGGNSTSGYTLKNGDNYLGMSGDKKVALSSTSSTWSISFSGTTATVSQLYTPTGKSEGNYSLQYNYNNSSDRFTGYTSAQVAVSLYKKSSGTTTYNSNPSCATCSNLINIAKGTPSRGSFTLTGAGTDICADDPVTVTLSNITADEHYHAIAVTTSAASGGGTPSEISAGSASVTGITASTTINVTFAEDTKVVVTLLNNNNPVNAGGFDAQGKKEYYTGETLGTLPTLTSDDACDAGGSNHFMGWTTEQISTKRSKAPDFVTPSTQVNAAMTLRAVWARAQ
ncbi:MAG: hypothetical protein KBS70_04260, partial [Bacteroidales bacterium]|nr:hypothetical protein [Candidatus Colicola equi]